MGQFIPAGECTCSTKTASGTAMSPPHNRFLFSEVRQKPLRRLKWRQLINGEEREGGRVMVFPPEGGRRRRHCRATSERVRSLKRVLVQKFSRERRQIHSSRGTQRAGHSCSRREKLGQVSASGRGAPAIFTQGCILTKPSLSRYQ